MSNEHTQENTLLGPWAMPALSAAMLLAAIIAEHFCALQPSATARLLYYVAAFLPVGLPVCREAIEEMTHGNIFSEFTLMTLAAIGAFVIGEYPEAVAVMLFYAIGENLQDSALDRASRNISDMLDVRPERTTVVRPDGPVEVAPADVCVGETIELKPGERVPLDGTLLTAGDAAFDTSALTGESVPRTIRCGQPVLAGMIVSGKSIQIAVTRPYDQSTLARILSMVRDASERKAPTELFIRKFARIYTPIVIALAAAITLLPAAAAPLMGFNYVFSHWLYRGLVFLVISCPCALVISVPLGYFAGIGAASRQGILFKGSNYLDAICTVDTVAFDKTGTLTKGRFEVFQFDVAADVTSRAGLLGLAMSVEARSTHPIAQAVVAYAKAQGATEVELASMDEIAGHGAEALTADGHRLLIGNSRLMAREGVAVAADFSDSVATVVICAIDGRYAGALLLADTLKDDAHQAIAQLHSQGIADIHILSGDKRDIVDHFAATLGIRFSRAELLPEDKANYISSLIRDQRRRVAFVGDGMNDAPVLATATVGIAMGGLGSDAAIESADIVIQNDMPSRVATAVAIGRRTSAIVRQNITGAIAVKLIILLCGALGYASLWGAVFADVGVALLAVANALRAASWQRQLKVEN
jgi:Cd2+/Zn2+-exporting ATPase